MRTLVPVAFVAVVACAAPRTAVATPSAPDGPTAASARAVQQPAAAEREWRTEAQLGAEYESLSNGYAPWRHLVFDVSGMGRAHRSWHAAVADMTRFSLRDQVLSAGIAHPVSSRATLSGELEVSPTHNVAASWTVAGRADAAIGGGWVVNAGLRHRRYDIARVNLVNLGLERYFGAYRLGYTAFVGHLAGSGASTSHLAQFDRFYGRDQANLLRVSVSAGHELERVGPDAILRTSVRSVALTGRQWVTARWGVTYTAGVHEQGALYTRRGAALGLRFRF